MSAHFSIAEFCASDLAARRGIDNTLPAALEAAAVHTLEMMERIRAYLSGIAGRDVPILLSSGYRCAALNSAIGSKRNSDHLLASAADWRAPAFGTPYEVAKQLAPHVGKLGIGQLIYEFDSWIHTSWQSSKLPGNRVITINRAGIMQGISK